MNGTTKRQVVDDNLYCTADDLYKFISGLTEDNDKAPKATFLTPVCREVSTRIDFEIEKLYRVPVLKSKAPKSFQILNMIAIDLSREKVAQRLDWVAYGAEAEQTSQWEMAVESANKRLMAIKEGEFDLMDAERCAGCSSFASGSYDISGLHGRQEADSYLDDENQFRNRRGNFN